MANATTADIDVDVYTDDPSKADNHRQYNPYDGMDPSDPNYVGIPPEGFREMMRKKKSMRIPSLTILKEKTEAFNRKPPGAINNKTVDIEKEEEEEEENIPPPPIFPK